ncbi:MAG: hypothetical protein SNJ72_05020 [Fimbriimonadales bacterium]
MCRRGITRSQALAFLLVWVTLLLSAELLHGAIHRESASPTKECPVCRLHATNGAVPDPAVLLQPVVQLVWQEYRPGYVQPLICHRRPAGIYRFSRAPPTLGVFLCGHA